jgi:plastocyanin
MDNQQPKQDKNKVFIFIILIAIVAFGIGVFLLSKQNNKPATNQITQPQARPLPKEVTVHLTKTGFVPASVKISAGGAIRWKNDSGDDNATVNSDDHPTHQKYKEMNLGVFSKGSTLVHIFDTPGTYTYHDHFHPDRKGTIVVE